MTTTETETTATGTDVALGEKLLSNDSTYAEILAFLVEEAELLDDDHYTEWLDLLAADITYEMPGRKTLYREDGPGFDEDAFHYRDNRMSLGMRARHNVDAPSAWYREPAPRAHRLVTNVTVRTTEIDGEYSVTSSILMMVNRYDQTVVDLFAAKRHDTIRRTPDGLRLAKRKILIDQAVLAQPFGNLFL